MSNHSTEIDFDDVGNVVFVDFEEKIKNNVIKAQLEYVTGYVLRKLKLNVLKNCAYCKKVLRKIRALVQ